MSEAAIDGKPPHSDLGRVTDQRLLILFALRRFQFPGCETSVEKVKRKLFRHPLLHGQLAKVLDLGYFHQFYLGSIPKAGNAHQFLDAAAESAGGVPDRDHGIRALCRCGQLKLVLPRPIRLI